MEKLFIPYEQALQLKELGFNELCIARFDGGGFRMLPTYDPLKNSEIKEAWFCVTPLYQQVFQFFRDKYKKYGTIRYGYNEFNKSVYLFPCINGIVVGNESFESYEQAELECLKKLIEIVKSN
jgi:hypothetical protein